MSRLLGIHKGAKKEVCDHNLIRRFEVSVFDDVKILTKKGTGLRYVAAEDMHEVFVSGHIATGHGGRDVMRKHLGPKFYNITSLWTT